ncbi:hypothetical protein, partial [Acidovorax sp.]|uniref:hypothetical protein n=1 Tax=Acidovorax sp. TaxID=1872122 RepID=UPI00403797B6
MKVSVNATNFGIFCVIPWAIWRTMSIVLVNFLGLYVMNISNVIGDGCVSANDQMGIADDSAKDLPNASVKLPLQEGLELSFANGLHSSWSPG